MLSQLAASYEPHPVLPLILDPMSLSVAISHLLYTRVLFGFSLHCILGEKRVVHCLELSVHLQEGCDRLR